MRASFSFMLALVALGCSSPSPAADGDGGTASPDGGGAGGGDEPDRSTRGNLPEARWAVATALESQNPVSLRIRGDGALAFGTQSASLQAVTGSFGVVDGNNGAIVTTHEACYTNEGASMGIGKEGAFLCAGTTSEHAGPATPGSTVAHLVSRNVDGSEKWSKKLAALDVHGFDIDLSGTPYILADYGPDVDIGGGIELPQGADQPMFVAKLDPNTGDAVWAKTFTQVTLTKRDALTIDGAGNIVFVATSDGTDFGGGARQGETIVSLNALDGAHRWSRPTTFVFALGSTRDGFVTVVDDGNAAFEGVTPFGEKTNQAIISYDAAGNVSWARWFSPNIGITDLSSGDDGALYAAANCGENADLGGGVLTAGGVNCCFAVYDATGAHRVSGAFRSCRNPAMTGTPAGDLFIAGIMPKTDFGGGVSVVPANMPEALVFARLSP